MTLETISYQDAKREIRFAIRRDLAQRAIDIVTAYHPKPVLGAKIEAQITEATPVVNTAEGEPLERSVMLNDGAVFYAIAQAVDRRHIIHSMRGNQSEYRLPADSVEARHVTI